MSHSQFHSIKRLYLDMHGLIFETSVWLLAESTRLLSWRNFSSFLANIKILKRKEQEIHICRLTKNFTHSITRIYCNTNAGLSRIKKYWHKGHPNISATKHNSAFKSLFLHTPDEASTNSYDQQRIVSPIAYSSHMFTLFARYTRWIPEDV